MSTISISIRFYPCTIISLIITIHFLFLYRRPATDYDDDDEADDNDMDEEGSVPAGVLEALPRRTFVRFFRQAAPCAICLDEPTTGLILVRLPCRHEFCEPCITEWLKRKNACPQCRAPIQK